VAKILALVSAQEDKVQGYGLRCWRNNRKDTRWAIVLVLSLAGAASAQSSAPSQDTSRDAKLDGILAYIHNSWDSLTRSTNSCGALSDTKVSGTQVLYLPADYPQPKDLDRLPQDCAVKIAHLPQVIRELGNNEFASSQTPGLLYLKNKYVVPGGRFNEMYGWDSYFIIRGLLRDGRIDLARGMVENFFFEIEHYGAILNANRTYYLTRSQPPFLSSMVMAVHEAEKAAGKDDKAWLATAYPYVKRDHAMWTRAPHLAGNTGLSRYYDFGEGPATEALQDENDIYRQVAEYFLLHPPNSSYEIEKPGTSKGADPSSGAPYSIRVCGMRPSTSDQTRAKQANSGQPISDESDSLCEASGVIKLKPDYYKGDRSMRESGFDISFRFGPYGAGTHHFAPVCLNSLLFKTERDLEEMSKLLGNPSEGEQWKKLAEARQEAMQKYLWDDRRGLFFDYNFDDQQRSSYVFATTFYPLWAGLATKAQAASLIKNLSEFEKPGGIATSLQESQGQWDYPFGWAPIQLIAVEGMRRYGYTAEADRVSTEFLSTVLENFERDKTIREKYNVVTRSSETNVTVGYAANVIGFGWTNGTFLELLHALPAEKVTQVSQSILPASR
jgi:alpha,alpha-trehalase